MIFKLQSALNVCLLFLFLRMSLILKRSQLIRQIQEQHAELLELSATLELQQLRTYPTLNIPIYQPDL